MDTTAKRGRGRGRGTRARGRGRGRGRGKKAAVVVSSDEEVSLDQSLDGISSAAIEDADVSTGSGNLTIDTTEDVVMQEVIIKECEKENILPIAQPETPAEEHAPPPPALPQTIDMEADISQLEAPTFTTISRGPPEPMLRLKWDHKVSLIGEKVLNPMIHCCDQCEKPILLYGRMIPCKHVFCLKCARAEPVKICPRCNDKVVRVEQSGLGTVFMCTHGGSRYGNTGCRRTYLSQRDLQAHINHRHVTQPPPMPPTAIQSQNDIKQDMDSLKAAATSSGQRKLSESAVNTASMLSQRPPMRSNTVGGILQSGGSTSSNTSVQQQSVSHSHSSLTQANIARINTANAQDCHQGKVALHQSLKKTPITQSHHQTSETVVADASYYSSVLNSFGTAGSGGGNVAPNATSAAAVGYGPSNISQQPTQHNQGSWQQNQYYR